MRGPARFAVRADGRRPAALACSLVPVEEPAMTTRTDGTRCEVLTDSELLQLLEVEEDHLPRDVVDEFVRRSARMVEPLTAMCDDPETWQGHLSPWLGVHATLILGAIGGARAMPGLLAAVRRSAYAGRRMELDDRLPRVLAAAGPAAIPELKGLVEGTGDIGIEDRAVAAEALGAIAARHHDRCDDILDFLRPVACTEETNEEDDFEGWEDAPARGAAARVLLDFARPGDRQALLELAEEVEYTGAAHDLEPDDVRIAYERGGPDLDRHVADFLDFYSPEALARRAQAAADRQEDERWAEADEAGKAWVEKQVVALLDAYSASLADPDEDARRVAVAVARSMIRFQLRVQRAAPWRWNGPAAHDYLMHFVAHVPLEERFLRHVPDLVVSFVRFLESGGRVATELRKAVEADVAAGRREFVRMALDAENWGSAKIVIAHVAANGAIPSDPDALDEWMTRLSKRLAAAEGALAKSRSRTPGGSSPGRNDPCPCGSGRKFKRCCGA